MAHVQGVSASTNSASEYYRSISNFNLHQVFEDLDDPKVALVALDNARNLRTHNFIVDFGLHSSYVAFNLSAPMVSALLSADRPTQLNTRWINIWIPSGQRAMLELLAQNYDFSPRLLGLMLSHSELVSDPSEQVAEQRNRQTLPKWSIVNEASVHDTERGSAYSAEHHELSTLPSNDSIDNANLFRLINEVWHYTAVDVGRRYVSIGYNSLYDTKDTELHQTDSRLPHCARIWTWLILCDDNTVISINEDPSPSLHGSLDATQLRVLVNMRRNILTVFSALSAAEQSPSLERHPLMLLPLRYKVGAGIEELAHYESDAPGLLFYYLFENWHNVASLVARRDSRYAGELEDLRQRMLHRPELAHIDRLHTMGTELSVLRRHYESYQRIIDRVLEPHEATQASLQNSHIIDDPDNVSLSTIRPNTAPLITEAESRLGVSISSAARVRFKRLKDMIDLYALSEVEDYLKQKDALVSMNFNLIAIKESRDVEKLTRVALLLTKCTILFLPVSFMASYFSLNLSSHGYTVTEFWAAFVVILAGSWLLLVVFGLYTESLQTMTMVEVIWSKTRRLWKWRTAA